MHRESFRKFAAFSMAAAVWFSAISFYPTAVAGQTTEDTKDAKDTTKKAKSSKKEDKPKPTAAEAQTQPQTAGTSKTLSVKEDPAQIGKRKINSGTDSLFGWLGGSQSKEVAVGRQLALEVEQQAKMIEDPIEVSLNAKSQLDSGHPQRASFLATGRATDFPATRSSR